MSRLTFLSLAMAAVAVMIACQAVNDSDGQSKLESSPQDNQSQELPGGFELATLVKLEKRAPIEAQGLHNVYVLSDNISSGSEPAGDAAFGRLQELGIKTVLSVDGKRPDVALAKKFGMTYVHIPIQYKGISHDAMVHIAKTFRELPAPFYVHCFHGRHRGPAAAAVGRLILDGISREEALAEMRQWFGTSSKYGGLYQVIARGALPSEEETAASSWNFESSHEVKGVAGTMVPIARSHDALKALAGQNWHPDDDHPDIDPVNEASILLEAFQTLRKMESYTLGNEKFRRTTDDAITTTGLLRDQLSRLIEGDLGAGKLALKSMKLIKRQCNACHASFRNK